MSDLSFLDDMEAGEEMNEPITEQQRHNLYKLIETSLLNDEQKDTYHRCIDTKMSYQEAECLKQDLLEMQQDLVSLARDGKLTENGPNGLKVASRHWCDRENT